jgi:hypothetical protein
MVAWTLVLVMQLLEAGSNGMIVAYPKLEKIMTMMTLLSRLEVF